ncbi:MAG: hypothetical protein LBS74_04125 [Oscillospiraceae bacterium]|jgi:hypothetical protein|nr:hypothetical protein [Oscillospiraceae bacterium]
MKQELVLACAHAARARTLFSRLQPKAAFLQAKTPNFLFRRESKPQWLPTKLKFGATTARPLHPCPSLECCAFEKLSERLTFYTFFVYFYYKVWNGEFVNCR